MMVYRYLLIFLSFFVLESNAQNFKFVRITNVGQIDASKDYVIASSHRYPHFLLSNEGAKRNSKLFAKQSEEVGDTIEITDMSLYWRISSCNGKYTLMSLHSGKYIAGGKSPTDLVMSNEPVEWNIHDGNSLFEFECYVDGKTRYLSCDTSSCYFGCFVDKNIYGNLVLYERLSSEADNDTTVILPDSLTEYCLVASMDGKYYAASSSLVDDSYLNFSDVSFCKLVNGCFSMWNDNLRWKTINCGNGIFKLQNSKGTYISPSNEGGAFLKVNNTVLQGVAADFHVTERGITTESEKKEELYLVFRMKSVEDGGFFCFVKPEQLENEGIFPVKIQLLAEKGTFSSDANGLKTLKGGYDTYMLAKSLEANTTSLDLRDIVLPEVIKDFDFDGKTNCIIYINKDMLAVIPASWNNVVVCDSANGNYAARIMHLEDKCDFHAAYPFHVGEDSIVYSREIPQKGWNTVCLPFDTKSVDEDVLLCQVRGIEDEVIILSGCNELVAKKPYLFRCKEMNDGNQTVTFKAKAGEVKATTGILDATNDFAGTFTRMDIGNGERNIYMLSPDGYRFVKAAAGSFLNPFRCFFDSDVMSVKGLVIDDGGLTGISALKVKSDNTIYSIEGIRIERKREDMSNMNPLAPGIYIMKGRKMILH